MCGEKRLGEGVAVQPGTPLRAPQGPHLPLEDPSDCFLEQLEAGVSWRPGQEPDGVVGGRPWGPRRVGDGPAGPGATKGRESAGLRRAASRPPAMWFQSNCPKILLQHEPRAIHSPATNQQQSYRINRFHTRGTGQPSARTPAPRPRPPQLGPVSCGGENGRDKGGTLRGSSSLWDPHPDSRAEREGPDPQVTACPGLRELAGVLGSRWGRSQASQGPPEPEEASAGSLHPDRALPRS